MKDLLCFLHVLPQNLKVIGFYSPIDLTSREGTLVLLVLFPYGNQTQGSGFLGQYQSAQILDWPIAAPFSIRIARTSSGASDF
jgi:hypothetical protein